MTEIIIIAAVAQNNIIGKDNDIPWRIPEDFKHFKKLTLGHPCIMGRKTYESLPIKPLPGRENIILTRDKNYSPENTTVFDSLDKALEYCKNKEKVYICGGATIYNQSIEIADQLEITRVHLNPEGDTKFPEIQKDKWNLIKSEKHEKYTFNTYLKK